MTAPSGARPGPCRSNGTISESLTANTASEHLALARHLHVVGALAVARPDIEHAARDRLALERQEPPGVERGLALGAVGDVGAERQFRRTFPVEGAEHGRFDRTGGL